MKLYNVAHPGLHPRRGGRTSVRIKLERKAQHALQEPSWLARPARAPPRPWWSSRTARTTGGRGQGGAEQSTCANRAAPPRARNNGPQGAGGSKANKRQQAREPGAVRLLNRVPAPALDPDLLCTHWCDRATLMRVMIRRRSCAARQSGAARARPLQSVRATDTVVTIAGERPEVDSCKKDGRLLPLPNRSATQRLDAAGFPIGDADRHTPAGGALAARVFARTRAPPNGGGRFRQSGRGGGGGKGKGLPMTCTCAWVLSPRSGQRRKPQSMQAYMCKCQYMTNTLPV